VILDSDSYKVSHYRQLPPGTTRIWSYLESRGGLFDSTVFFGLQYILKKHLVGKQLTDSYDLDWAEEIINGHIGPGIFNRAGWQRIIDVHNGYLPLEIRAVPEGTDVPTGNILMSVVNTDPKLPWLTNYVETLLMQVWYPISVCTLSNRIRALILRYLEETGDPGLIDFKLHDFGFRGVSSHESAAIGGLAHLVNFLGTDTMAALDCARSYYGCKMAGFSVPASEHSTITSWGRSREVDAYANMLAQFPAGIVACVSDSYDIYNACRNLWGGELKDRVTERDGVLVVRPDSGNPREVVRRVVQILDQQFGSSLNKKGYRVLDPHVRVIQGDGVDRDSIDDVLSTLKEEGYAADNVTFGMGGALLQKLNRDTQKMAFKCSAVEIDSEWVDVWKDPTTDPGKRSKKGRLKLIKAAGWPARPMTVREDDPVWLNSPEHPDLLQTVFKNGELLIDQDLDTIRERVKGAAA
jgi:nicotinamide phosphoribosyltransferase